MPRRVSRLTPAAISIANRETQSPVERRKVSPALAKAWSRALEVTPQDVAQHIGSETECQIGEALLAGQLSVETIAKYIECGEDKVRGILGDPVAMAWISQQIYAHFQHRAALVDAALYQQAVSGDISAMKLFYERMGKLTNDRTVKVQVSGGYDVRTLSDDELKKLIQDGKARLPKNVIDAEFSVAPGPGTPGAGADGAAASDGGSAVPVLPAPAGEPPPAA